MSCLFMSNDLMLKYYRLRYALMQSCWMENPLMRPTFQEITKRIRYFLRKVKVSWAFLLVTVSVLPAILKGFFSLPFSVPVY